MPTLTILSTAYNLLGDGQGREWNTNVEYTRALVDLIADTVGIPAEIVDPGGTERTAFVFGMIHAAHLLARQPASSDLQPCVCGDPTCSCDCVPGHYPCEHGSMGEGCGS